MATKKETSNSTENAKPAIKLARKIVPALIKGKAPKITAGMVGRLVGEVSGMETVTTPYGESTRFLGSFLFVDNDGAYHRSGVAFLPALVESMISDAFHAMEDPDAKLRIGMDISTGAYTDTKGNESYTWEVTPLVEMQAAPDPLLALMAETGSPQLTA